MLQWNNMKALFIFLIFSYFLTAIANEATFSHLVRTGQSLMTISNEYYNTHQCWKLIANRNNISDNKSLVVNSSLLIPPRSLCQKSKNHLTEISKPPQLGLPEISITAISKKDEHIDRFFLFNPKGNKYSSYRSPKISKKIELTKRIPASSTNFSVNIKKPYTIQLAAFEDYQEAIQIKDQLGLKGHRVRLERGKDDNDKNWYRLRSGQFKTMASAKLFMQASTMSKQFPNFFIIKEQ